MTEAVDHPALVEQPAQLLSLLLRPTTIDVVAVERLLALLLLTGVPNVDYHTESKLGDLEFRLRFNNFLV